MSRTYDVLAGTGAELAPPKDAPRLQVLERPGHMEAEPPPSAPRPEPEAGKAFGLEDVPVEEIDLARLSRVAFVATAPGVAADRFRYLRLRLLESPQNLKRLLVTSPQPQDGKTTAALNLATTLAEGGKRAVLLIDADLHHSALSRQLGFGHCAGLVDCLRTGLNPMAAIRRLEPAAWYFLPAGRPCSDPTELLQSGALSRVMAELGGHFDRVVMDSPPVAPLTDALSLRKEADATLLVVKAGRTPREAVEEAIALVGQKHVFAILLNGVEGMDRLYSKYYRHRKELA